MSWSTSELRVRLAPLNRFKPSSEIFYWPFQGGTSFVDLLCFCSILCLLCFVHVCLYVLCGHLLGKGWPLSSRLWCLLWVCHFPIGILGQVWYLIVSIPDLCTITYFLFIVTPIVGVCICSMFCCTLLYVHSSIAIILIGKRELVTLLNLSSWCLVMVYRLFLTVPRVICGLWLWYFLIILTYYLCAVIVSYCYNIKDKFYLRI